MATYTDQQILDAAKQALIDVLAGKRVRVNDGQTEREVGSEDIDKIQKLVDTYQARVDGAAAHRAGLQTFGGLRFSRARLDGR
jgi:hypothetical protein